MKTPTGDTLRTSPQWARTPAALGGESRQVGDETKHQMVGQDLFGASRQETLKPLINTCPGRGTPDGGIPSPPAGYRTAMDKGGLRPPHPLASGNSRYSRAP